MTEKFLCQKKTQRKLLMLIIVVASIAGVIIKILYFGPPPVSVLTESQKNQALEKMLGRSVSSGVSAVADDLQGRETPIFHFAYPVLAHVVEESTSSASLLRFSYSVPSQHCVATLQIQRVPAHTPVTDVAGVKLRQLQTSEYQPWAFTFPAAAHAPAMPLLAFTQTKESVQKAVFFVDGNYSASLAVTGLLQTEVDHVFQQLIDSLEFHD